MQFDNTRGHSAYSSNAAISKYHFFRSLQHFLKEKDFLLPQLSKQLSKNILLQNHLNFFSSQKISQKDKRKFCAVSENYITYAFL